MANISNQPQPQWMTTLAPTRGVPTLREMMVTRATEIPPKEVPGATVIPPPARPRSLAPEASELPRPDPAWAQPRPVATTGPPPEGRAEWRQQMRQTLFLSAPPLDWATLEYRLTEAKEDEARQVENYLLEVRGAHFWALREARRSRLQAKRTMTAEEVWCGRSSQTDPAGQQVSYVEVARGGARRPKRQRPPLQGQQRGPSVAKAGPGPAPGFPLATPDRVTDAEVMAKHRTQMQQAEWMAAALDQGGPVHLGHAAIPAYWPRQWNQPPKTGSDMQMAWRVRRLVTSLAKALHAAQEAAMHVRGQLNLLAALAEDVPGAAPPKAPKPSPVGAQRRKPTGC
jgi:hypothetical protein